MSSTPSPAPTIDAHIHIFGRGYLPAKWYEIGAQRWAASRWPPRDPQTVDIESGLLDPECDLLIPEMDAAGVDAAVCMALDWGAEFGEPDVGIMSVHEHYGHLQERFGSRLHCVAAIDPRRPSAASLLEESIRSYGLKGLKLYPPSGYSASDKMCFPLYEKCLELDVPVVIHTAFVGYPHRPGFADPIAIGDVQAEFPDLRIVLAHSGYPLWVETAIELAAHHPSTYLELSNWNWQLDKDPEGLVDLILRMRDAAGAHRILFATDHLGGKRFSGTRSRWADWVSFVRALPEAAAQRGATLSDEELRLIMGENAARVFSLEGR